MPVTVETPGPYAPASVIVGLVERYRDKGLPAPVNLEVLGRANVSDSLAPRTLQALMTLDLIGPDGTPTPTLESLRLAPEAEFQDRVRDWLNAAYEDVLQYIDPATATEVQMRDAFRHYKPVGQQPRMVTLFSGLFKYAGVATQTQPARKKAMPKPGSVPRQMAKQRLERPRAFANAGGPILQEGIHPAIQGLLSSLPKNGWTQAERDRFYATFGAVLDFAYPPGERSIDHAYTADGDHADT